MRLRILPMLALPLLPTSICAAEVQQKSQACIGDNIAHITLKQAKMQGYGPEITTRSGHDFFVLGQDLVDPKMWHDGDRLTVCAEPDHPEWVVRGYQIVDEARNGEHLPVDEKK